MDIKLSKRQALAVYTLLLNDGEEPTLSAFKAPFKKYLSDHDQLFDTKLVEIFKKPRGRTGRVKLSERGWLWAEENLGVALYTKSFSGTKALEVLLKRLKHFITARELRLADLLTAKSQDAKSPRDQVRHAYLKISGGTFNSPIPIADLGREVAYIPRQTFLDQLMSLHQEGTVFFTGKDDPQSVSDQDRLYAVQLLDKPRYNVAFKK